MMKPAMYRDGVARVVIRVDVAFSREELALILADHAELYGLDKIPAQPGRKYLADILHHRVNRGGYYAHDAGYQTGPEAKAWAATAMDTLWPQPDRGAA